MNLPSFVKRVVRSGEDLLRALQKVEHLDAEAKAVAGGMAQEIADGVRTALCTLSKRAVAENVARTTSAQLRPGKHTLAESLVPQDGTTVLAVKDQTPLTASQLFDCCPESSAQLVVDLQAGTNAPPPTNSDWRVLAKIDRFGATVGSASPNWIAVRAIVYGRTPRAEVVVAPEHAHAAAVQQPAEDRLAVALNRFEERLAAERQPLEDVSARQQFEDRVASELARIEERLTAERQPIQERLASIEAAIRLIASQPRPQAAQVAQLPGPAQPQEHTHRQPNAKPKSPPPAAVSVPAASTGLPQGQPQ